VDIDLLMEEIEIALIKVIKGKVTKSQTEQDEFKLTVYKVGDVVRIDIKQKLNS
jgi:hypothetical protein